MTRVAGLLPSCLSVCLSVGPLICDARVENLIAHMFVGPGCPDALDKYATYFTFSKSPALISDLGSCFLGELDKPL